MLHKLQLNKLRHINKLRVRSFMTTKEAQTGIENMSLNPKSFDRASFEALMKRRFFYATSFDIYGGISGLYDYGPPGCAIVNNFVDLWRRHFVIKENMLEVDCSILTPYDILKASGHVDKFADWMCKDPASGEIFRADHLVKDCLEKRLARNSLTDETNNKKKTEIPLTEESRETYSKILATLDDYDGKGLKELIDTHKVCNPSTGTKLEDPVQFNLMFSTQIGPTGAIKAFLRPETAQGQFLNFNRLYDYNQRKVPFASASIGKSFRNEISPRSGLLRVREFLMAEIEHFVDPENKNHPNFSEVSSLSLPLLSRERQFKGETAPVYINIGEAVRSKVVDNTTLGYFLARIYSFLQICGIKETHLRFRQHLANEMAHYATDCWDAEIHTSYGWIECVGCADRSAYDLTVHSKRTNVPLVIRETLAAPVSEEVYEIEFDKKAFGMAFRGQSKDVMNSMLSWTDCEMEEAQREANNKESVSVEISEGQTVSVPSTLFKISKVVKQKFVREYTPNVIEPSFGVGRLIYAIMEHAFWVREDDAARGVLSFSPVLAPSKVLVLPLSGNDQFKPIVTKIQKELQNLGISHKVDDSGAQIGRRYARNDELGIPFGITVDFQTLKDNTITLRERDTTKQIRGDISSIIAELPSLCQGRKLWEEILTEYDEYTGVQSV